MEVVEASFNTSTEAMSCGAMTDKAFSTCTPSTMYKGELSWVIDPPPRTRITTSAPGAPSDDTTCTPASRPCNISAAEDNGTSLNCRALTDETEPVTSLLCTVE